MSNLTKIAFANSLKNELNKKDINKITIEEIAEDVGVNRKTFYYHFSDIYSLIEWIYENEVIDELKKPEYENDWKKAYKFITGYILKNKKFIMKTYKLSELNTFIFNQTCSLIKKKIDEKNFDITEKEKIFLARFYSHAIVGILIDWVNSGMIDLPDKIIENIDKAIRKYIDIES